MKCVVGVSVVHLPFRSAKASTPTGTPSISDWLRSVEVGNSLYVVDWRLFPKPDRLRFIAEVRNTSETMILAPSLGVVIPSLPDAVNFAWGTPFTPVIYPDSSTFITGVAPEGIQSDQEWGDADWVICDSASHDSIHLAETRKWEIELDSHAQVKDPMWMQCTVTVTNHSNVTLNRIAVQGILRDTDGRICGGTFTANLNEFEPEETREITVNVRLTPNHRLRVDPFYLIDDITGCTASFTIQPYSPPVNPGCPAIMPWNR